MLEDVVEVGDILLMTPRNLIGNIIRKMTFGKVNHAALIYDKKTIFETDGDMVQAGFNPLSKYEGRKIYICRYSFRYGMTNILKELCKAYDKRPYSYFDIATNAIFFFLAEPIRTRVVSFFSNKYHMICSELVARIMYESTNDKIWKQYEGMTPEDIRKTALANPDIIKIIKYNQ